VDYSHIPRILLKNVYCAISVCAKAAKQGDAFSYLVTKTNKRTKNTKELKIQKNSKYKPGRRVELSIQCTTVTVTGAGSACNKT
jgi:hypothetical protein